MVGKEIREEDRNAKFRSPALRIGTASHLVDEPGSASEAFSAISTEERRVAFGPFFVEMLAMDPPATGGFIGFVSV